MLHPFSKTDRAKSKFVRWHSWSIAFGCVGLAIATIIPMAIGNYPLTHSTHFNLSWVFQYQAQADSGQWYPRWLDASNYGFGNPTFAFYPPLCMLSTLPFHALGLDMAMSLVASMGLAVLVFLGGLYLYARTFFPHWIASVVAACGAATPYLFVDLYLRGAIAEVWGIAAIPWLLWLSHLVVLHYCQDRSPAGGQHPGVTRHIPCTLVVGVAVAYGGLILSHLPTLLMVTCLWALLPLLATAQSGRLQQWLRTVTRSAIALSVAALGAGGWTAAYLWPVLFDRHQVQLDRLNSLPDYRPSNRLLLDGLLSFRPQLTQHWFDRSLIAPWLIAVTLAIGTWLIHYLMRPKHSHQQSTPVQIAARYWLSITVIALLMTTDGLGWVYEFVPPLQRIQFSWRWMTVLCTTLPLIIGYVIDVARREVKERRRIPAAIAFTFALGIAIANLLASGHTISQAVYDPTAIAQFIQLANEKSFPSEPTQQPQQPFFYWHWIHPDGLALVDVPEYRHRAASLPIPPTRVFPLLEWQESEEANPVETNSSTETATLSVQRWEYGLRQFTASNPLDVARPLQLRTFYYPGWTAILDDRTIPSEHTTEGQLQVSIPPGTHQVTLRYTGTRSHRVGLWVSAGSIAMAAMGAAYGCMLRSPRSDTALH